MHRTSAIYCGYSNFHQSFRIPALRDAKTVNKQNVTRHVRNIPMYICRKIRKLIAISSHVTDGFSRRIPILGIPGEKLQSYTLLTHARHFC